MSGSCLISRSTSTLSMILSKALLRPCSGTRCEVSRSEIVICTLSLGCQKCWDRRRKDFYCILRRKIAVSTSINLQVLATLDMLSSLVSS